MEWPRGVFSRVGGEIAGGSEFRSFGRSATDDLQPA